MDDHDQDDPQADESRYRLADHIERGDWPIELPYAVELRMQDGRPRVSRGALPDEPDEPGTPGPITLPVTVRLDRARMRQIVLEMIAETADRDQRKLAGLSLLARIDRECFLCTAAEHFADVLCASGAALHADPLFAGFLLDLHQRDPELIVELVESAASLDRQIGKRLRDAILEATSDPQCRDELGLLAAAELTERLEGPCAS